MRDAKLLLLFLAIPVAFVLVGAYIANHPGLLTRWMKHLASILSRSLPEITRQLRMKSSKTWRAIRIAVYEHLWRASLVAAFIILLAACVVFFPRRLVDEARFTPDRSVLSQEKFEELRLKAAADHSKTINDVRTTLLQGLAGLVLLAGALATWRQLQATRQGQITERFTKAVDQLGSMEIAVRLGGIYALERIAHESATDHDSVMALLTAFVREHAPWRDQTSPGSIHISLSSDIIIPQPRIEISAILTVIGRRRVRQNERALDLRATDLRAAPLQGADLKRARLDGAALWRADLRAADLRGADLVSTDLRGARLHGALIHEAKLWHTFLQGVDLTEVFGLTKAQLAMAQLNNETLYRLRR